MLCPEATRIERFWKEQTHQYTPRSGKTLRIVGSRIDLELFGKWPADSGPLPASAYTLYLSRIASRIQQKMLLGVPIAFLIVADHGIGLEF